ncbi:VOC family protein [Actinospongicola halichondriae]|uniref:VOC family protein n=1 Tax=Actinospongicola halichondriae TaxID=3236844 RepID=UPI003D4DE783
MSLQPYLFFTDTAREAMTRYQEIFGGKLDILGLDSVPAEDREQMPFEAPEGYVMHAALVLPDGEVLLASDDPTGDGKGVTGISINITTTDADDARRMFDALADGGEIGMPLDTSFWSPLFGTCRDRFGVNWMINVEAEENA